MGISPAIFGALGASVRSGALFYSDGSSLSGWTVSGVTVDASAGNGNPAPGFRAWPNGNYAYIQPAPALSFTNGRKIRFDARLANTNALVNLFFANNASGVGFMLRLDSRTSNACGIATTSSWTTWAAPSGTVFTTTDANWHTYEIQFKAGNTVDVLKDGVVVISGRSLVPNGNYIGMQGDAGGSGGYIDNIYIL